MFPHGPHDICHSLHVPQPGRVQYYYAQQLPFVPNEVKTQIRFPKAFATSQQNLRYLDRVREQTLLFLKDNVKGNLFNGTDEVELNTTLGEAEVLFAANDNVNELAESGNLKQLHDNCNNLSEAAESSYINCKDRLMGLIGAGHNKEDEVVETLQEDHEITGIRKHNIFGESVFDMMCFTYKMASVENLSILAGEIDRAEDKLSLQLEEAKLVSLLGSKVKVLE